jgi:hypothetical protein
LTQAVVGYEVVFRAAMGDKVTLFEHRRIGCSSDGRFPKALESFPAVMDGIPMSLRVWPFAWVAVTVGSTRQA